MVILNENEYAENMINERSLGEKPYNTLCMVSRYYIDKGYDKHEARSKLDMFMLQCDPLVSLPKWSAVMDKAFSRALKRPAVNIDHITIYKAELDTISKLDGKPIKRLAFTLLCLSKYWDLVTSQQNHWVNTKDGEIKKMANINTSIKRESAMYKQLRDSGLIEFSKKVDNLNVRVCFIEEDEPVLEIDDFRNLGNQYLMFTGEPYYKCQNCGVVTKLQYTGKGSRPKYCKSCAKEIAVRQRINYVMQNRIKVQPV